MVDNSDDYDKVDDRKSHDSGNERFIRLVEIYWSVYSPAYDI